MSFIEINDLKKEYDGGKVGVSEFTLNVEKGEFIVLLGGHEAGKTCVLKMLTGLDEITSGEFKIDGVLMNGLQPKDRDVAIVSRGAGLYQHLNIFDNLAFGLKLRKIPTAEIEDRVYDMANLLGLTGILSRKPKTISAFERQRVAIGRALVRSPRVVFLDEPFSDYDGDSRLQLRNEILKLQQRLNATFIYATSNAVEAMTLADRIVFMEKGKILQVGTPKELYDNPQTISIARYIGKPPINLFEGKTDGENFEFFGNKIALEGNSLTSAKNLQDKSKKLQLAIRAEDIILGEDFQATCQTIQKISDEKSLLTFAIDGDRNEHFALILGEFEAKQGDTVGLKFNKEYINLYDFETEIKL